jgi:hypothetical protein
MSIPFLHIECKKLYFPASFEPGPSLDLGFMCEARLDLDGVMWWRGGCEALILLSWMVAKALGPEVAE